MSNLQQYLLYHNILRLYCVRENQVLLDLDEKPDIEYSLNISVKSDIGENNIFNVKSEVKKWLTEKVNIFGLYKHEYYNEKEDFQFKVGIGVKLWVEKRKKR